ncbi:15115_t:CDS:2 [Cetraspora pellucida]|uniref:15115_t:CDS:1 n=1 Tax=Cetraspora pellucida TaxID=1433469 RepID=A0A9N9I1K0_9GLOM|nr:15115_t:CDS:2 [Cetraspora pellucida]
MSNTKQELHYYGLELTEEEIQTVFQDVTLFSEDIKEESIDDLDEPDNFDDSEVKYQNLKIKDLIMLNNFNTEVCFCPIKASVCLANINGCLLGPNQLGFGVLST